MSGTEEELADRGAPHGLSATEVAAADAYGMGLGRYAALRNVQSRKGMLDLHDFESARADDAEREAALVEARRMLAVDAMKRRLAAEATS